MSKEKRNVLRDVMNEMWVIAKSSALTKSEALKRAWRVVRLKAELAAGKVVEFMFEKADGTFRQAFGLAAGVGRYLVKGTGSGTPKANMLYWDVEADGFRSFAKSRLLAVGMEGGVA